MDEALTQFLAEEATPYVRKIIFDALTEHGLQPTKFLKKFEFNRFNVTLDFKLQTAFIEDILDPSASGETCLTFIDLLKHIAT